MSKVTPYFGNHFIAASYSRKFNLLLILKSYRMADNVLDVEYIGSYRDVRQCPSFELPEYCFIGRSNVGKSSIINLVTGKKEIARTSRKPGKTQSINIFKVTGKAEWIIADLPGYGFAQVSKSMRGEWSAFINRYIIERETLMCTFLLLDIRHPRMENDRLFMNFLGEHGIPFCILYTKSDKLKPAELDAALEAYNNELLTEWDTLPPYIVTSSLTEKGKDEILKYIDEMNSIFANQLH